MNEEKKVALVTGGAQGIGKAIAKELAENGFRIVIIDVDETAASETAEELGAVYYILDIADIDRVTETVDNIIEKERRIDLLVNNAGITRDNLIIRMNDNEWDQVLEINLKGVFNITKQVVKKSMVKNRTGNIVNIASIIGVIGNAGQANYAASKGGLIALTKTMAKEFSKRGIRVNAVAPGFIKTRMTDKLSDSVKDKYLEVIPLGRLGTADEVASTVSFLASEKSGYITGQVINVDGGMVM